MDLFYVAIGLFLIAGIVPLLVIRNRTGAVDALDEGLEKLPDRNDMAFIQHEEDMRSAIAQAKSSMDAFWKAIEVGSDTIGAGVKIGLASVSSELEHVWLSDVSRDGENWRGLLAVDPNDLVSDLKFGDLVEFDLDQVTDWFYEEADGRCRGHFTTRILVVNWTDEQKEAAGVSFHDNPIP